MTLFKNYLENEIEALEAAPSGASIAATPFTTETAPNPVNGDPMTVVVFPGIEDAALAFKVAGDDFPRFLLLPGDALFIGDGTHDPFNDQGGNVFFAEGRLVLGGSNVLVGGTVSTGGDLTIGGTGTGVVIRSPNNSKHRLKVANDGTVSSEPVV